MGMFTEIEREKRKKLILLYKKYIKNKQIKNIEKLVEAYTYNAGYAVYSKEFNFAAWKAHEMINQGLSIGEAKKILAQLKALES